MIEDHPNVALAQKLWTAVAESDADGMSEVLAEGVVWRAMGRNPLSGEYHGPDGVVDYLVSVGSLAEGLLLDLLKVFVNDEGVVLLYHLSGSRKGKTLEQEVLLMRFVDDMTLSEIAEALETPLGTVRSRLHRALEALREDSRVRAYFFD